MFIRSFLIHRRLGRDAAPFISAAESALLKPFFNGLKTINERRGVIVAALPVSEFQPPCRASLLRAPVGVLRP
jgi:hypothetical protein